LETTLTKESSSREELAFRRFMEIALRDRRPTERRIVAFAPEGSRKVVCLGIRR